MLNDGKTFEYEFCSHTPKLSNQNAAFHLLDMTF